MAAPPCVFELPDGSSVLYAVACDDHKLPCFQQASHLMQEALQLQADELNKGVERRDGWLEEVEAWSSELIQALRSVDDEAGAPWRLFTLATVKLGPFKGMQAIGIGSNQNRLKRSSNLALAFTIAHRTSHVSPELRCLATVPIRPTSGCEIVRKKERKPTCHDGTSTEEDGDEVLLSTSVLTNDWDVHDGSESSDTMEAPVKSPMEWLDADSPVDCAKQRLVVFRRHVTCAGPELQKVIRNLLSGKTEPCFASSDTVEPVLQDLKTVLEFDKWKGEKCGHTWIQCWGKWEAPFTDSSNFHFGKGNKALANFKWYFGCDSPTQPSSSPDHSICVSKALEAQKVPAKLPSVPVEKVARTPGANFTDDYPSRLSDLEPRVPRAPPACALPLSNLVCKTPPSSRTSSHSSRSQESDRDNVLHGLTRDEAYESLTIGTLTSADTIPLGTDLDPQNQYNNLWGARQIQDPNGRLLVQFNLCCRVLDGENLGYSFGNEVLGRQKHYDVEGVKRAVEHFQKTGIDVVVVTKRQDLSQCHFGDGVQVVVAERTDDLMVLKQAQSRNCPIVSRDGFAQWKKDLRVARELRQWLSESAHLQVRFSWGTGGEFVPDFDLPRPILRPQHSD